MDQGHAESDAPSMMRRRRKIARQQREKTPDPGAMRQRQRISDDGESSSTLDQNIQTVRMQIRPPGPISAHESKILRRRDKTFPGSAARSHSQPRQAEKLSSPEATDLIHSVAKRSLSSPRHKDESSEGDSYIGEREHRSTTTRYVPSPPRRTVGLDEEKLTRLEQNLQRFEDERRRFEMDKRKFEKEKRDHKLRYKHIMDVEERRKMLQNYRKLSDQNSDLEEKQRLVQSMRQPRREAPVVIKKRSNKYESSTAMSSSDSEADHETAIEPSKNRVLSPGRVGKVQERKSVSRNSSLSPLRYNDATIQRESPQRPIVPVRRSFSRNNSLSPNPDGDSLKREASPIPPVPPERKIVSRNASLSPIRKPERKKSISESPAESIEPPRTLRKVSNGESESVKLRRKTSTRKQKTDASTHIQEKQQLTKNVDTKKSRKTSESETEIKQIKKKAIIKPKTTKPTVAVGTEKNSLLEKFLSIFKQSKPETKRSPQIVDTSEITRKTESQLEPQNMRLLTIANIRELYREMRFEWRRLKDNHPAELEKFRCARNLCFAHFMILTMLCGFGGLIFRYTEGSFEDIYKCEVRKVKRDFIENLWTVSHNLREDDWKSLARNKLRKFEEELHIYHQLGIKTFPGMKPWNFVNSVIYCWTVVSTIGYGHIVPQTALGRSLTIVYAIIGIPMFLILLADFGKVFTRGLKFLWAYVRRLYYTGTCRKVRKQHQVQDMIHGINAMYDMAVRRPSSHIINDVNTNGPNEVNVPASGSGNKLSPNSHVAHLSIPVESTSETPSSQYMETFEIDDEFNLPVSLASTILIMYIIFGAIAYYALEEKWSFFEAFYFVFISMSTIGFGDFVPNHPIFMMCSILYLVFGLALTSMFINVVQIKLSDTFRQASTKIGVTMGLSMSEEESQSEMQTPLPIPESLEVQQTEPDQIPGTITEKETEGKN